MTWLLALRAFGGKALDWLSASRLHLALAALALALLWGWYGHHEAAKWHRVADSRETALRQAEDASKAELARASAVRAAAIQQAKDDDDATDKRVEDARADDARRVADYARRLRDAGSRDRCPVPASAAPILAESGDRPGSAPVMDALTADLAICTENTRRLLEIHKEATDAP